MTRESQKIERGAGQINEDLWDNPAVLDSVLLESGLIRSDAGAQPGQHINVARVKDESKEILAGIAAALALQRAILTLASCEDAGIRQGEIKAILLPTSDLGELYEALLMADVKDALIQGIDAVPPGDIFAYKQNAVVDGLVRAINTLERPSYEQLGVANDLSGGEDLLTRLPINTVYETTVGRGARGITTGRTQADRNAVAWLQRNPSADDIRLGRYLKGYGTTADELYARL